jgi:hypothetical protein
MNLFTGAPFGVMDDEFAGVGVFEPPRAPARTPVPVTGAKGSSARLLGDYRPSVPVRRLE